jgi:hypothetical protein
MNRTALVMTVLTWCLAGTPVAMAQNGPDVDIGGLKWHQENTDKFSVKDGVLILDKGRGWLRSDKEYGDFVLKIEWAFIDKGADGGIFIRSSKESGGKNGWPLKAIQVQCMDNDSLGRVFGDKAVAASAKTNVELVKKLRKPTGATNVMEIRCAGKNLEIKLNGEVITTGTNLMPEKGYIGIQAEGGTMHFKSIELKELK